MAAMGTACLAVFGIHYMLSIRFAVGSSYLREYWSIGMPPESAGLPAALAWLFRQTGPFATKPGGSLEVLLWVASVCGFLFGRPRRLAIVFAAVPISASLLALIRLVPLYERLGLWVVPSLYVGVGLAIDAGIQWVRDGYQRRSLVRAAVGAIVACAGVSVCVDIADRGWRDAIGRPQDSNHLVDDRAAVRWLLSVKQPGDAVLTSILGLPAVWWYGGASIAPPASGGVLSDGTRLFEVSNTAGDARCGEDALGRALAGHDRVLVYFGFGLDDVPAGFADLLLRQLESLGHVSEFRRFSGQTRAAIVDLTTAPPSPDAVDRTSTGSDPQHGCIGARPAVRW
jgi:hypothetical protein